MKYRKRPVEIEAMRVHAETNGSDHRCQRIDEHPAHSWARYPHEPYWCNGDAVTTEGGWSRCGSCGTSGVPHPVGGDECAETAREKAISQGDE